MGGNTKRFRGALLPQLTQSDETPDGGSAPMHKRAISVILAKFWAIRFKCVCVSGGGGN